MGIRTVQFAEFEFYHIYNRGVDKRNIFRNTSDYDRFQELLFLSNSPEPVSIRNLKKTHDPVFSYQRVGELVSIGAYCLMPNHFHLLLTPRIEDGVSVFMKKLGTGYSMYFNQRYERTGSLFEGRFKAQLADTDEYLKYLYAYIHLNPLKLTDKTWKETGVRDVKKAFEYVSRYQYSSLPDYLGENREEGVIISASAFPNFFQNSKAHQQELFEWLTYEK